MRRVKIDWQGKQVDAEEVGWDVVRGEDWSVYKLSDGTTLKVKVTVGKIVRLEERHPDGEPIYVVNTLPPIIVAHVEPHLMVTS
jgi:hypothetical protein